MLGVHAFMEVGICGKGPGSAVQKMPKVYAPPPNYDENARQNSRRTPKRAPQ